MKRLRRWNVGILGPTLVVGCAELVGLNGDYHEAREKQGAGGGGATVPGGDGGEGPLGGVSGTEGGRGGVAATGGSGDAGNSGSSGAAGTSGNAGRGGGAGKGGASGTGGTFGTGGDPGSGTGGSGGDGGPVQPSCERLAPTCGLHADVDCCDRERIPGDDFDRSNDARYPATVSDFELDVFEATVGRFRRFVDAIDRGFRPEAGAGKNANDASDPGWDPAWDDLLPANRDELVSTDKGVLCVDPGNPPGFWTWTDDPGTGDNRPINCLDWYVAFAFCIWDGGRLPTEAEWNFAAAGGRQQRHFPWSDPPGLTTIGETYASYNVDESRECGGDGMDGCAPTDIIPVGSKKDGYARWRQADLAGNLWEWVRDEFAPYSATCLDCARLDSGTNRVGRGGCYFSNSGLLDTPSRVEFVPGDRTTAIGVRCARNAAE